VFENARRNYALHAIKMFHVEQLGLLVKIE